MTKNILVTGGAGYIGSHTVLVLLEAGYNVTVIDNLTNSSAESLKRVEDITGKQVTFIEGDVCNQNVLDQAFAGSAFDGIIHFAGLKAVGESVAKPLQYYQTNIDSTLALCAVMEKYAVRKLIFSSSATVYGSASELPLKETSQTGIGISSPYGWSKYMIEQMLQDISAANPDWRVTVLRYFNPIGAHESGRIGEDPNGVPNNLLPFVAQVAVGKREKVMVFGNDYDTPDGTGVRDYIHVMDLARGHLAALEQAAKTPHAVYNLGTGKGVSVLEAIQAFETAAGHTIPYEVVARRPGDVASNYADNSKAKRELGWQTTKSLPDACNDAWRWQSQNPNGYTA
jgi:UDP-glucose 4-epimerase